MARRGEQANKQTHTRNERIKIDTLFFFALSLKINYTRKILNTKQNEDEAEEEEEEDENIRLVVGLIKASNRVSGLLSSLSH